MNKKISIATIFGVLLILVFAGYFLANRPQKGNDQNLDTTTSMQNGNDADAFLEEESSQLINLDYELALLFAEKYQRDPANIEVEVEQVDEENYFARGTVNLSTEPGDGGVWYAARTETGWEIAHDGNGIITCGAVNKYGFPVTMVQTCIDEENNNELIQR